MDPRPHLVGGEQSDALGKPGKTVGIDLVGPALCQCGIEQSADRFGVCALRAIGGNAPQGGVHREATDPVLAGRAPQYRPGGESQMCETLTVCGRHGLGDLTDQLIGVVSIHRACCQQGRELGGVGEPFVNDIDEVVLLDRVEDLHEARVAEQRGGPGRGQHGAGSWMIRGEQMDAHRAAQLLVDSTPAAEPVQTGDALLEAVTSGKFVATVQIGGR